MMKLETLVPQTTQHYSLMSLMYGHQFNQFEDTPAPGLLDFGLLQQQDLASHIEDFCDCV